MGATTKTTKDSLRPTHMRPSRLFPTLLLTTVLVAPSLSKATVLTFDDLPPSTEESPGVPDGYGGINWSNGGWNYFGEVQSPYTAHSGTNRAYSYNLNNRFGFIAGPVVFDGAWFSGGSAYDNGTPTNDKVMLALYLDGAQVAQSTTLAISATPTFLTSGYSGPIDSVGIDETVVRPTNTDFVMDDVTFHAAETPEPASIILLALALTAGGRLLRNRNNNSKNQEPSPRESANE